jgi:ribosomal peptide maturation radical SAM protein 1
VSRVLLVNMPFSSLRWPALGISLLKAALARVEVACDLAYFNFDLAEAVGLKTYQWINESFGFVLGGERLFARELFGDALPDDEAYHREILLAADPGFGTDDRAEFEAVGSRVVAFLDDCWSRTDWSQYAVVGFTTTFQQTLAALSLARRIRESHPGIVIGFGGANCEGEMGAELLRRFSQVDLVFSGESDRTFPQVVAAILEGKPVALPPGVLGRGGDTAVSACAVIENLDELPFPDFDDYFARLASSPLRTELDPLLLFETARGCWWGAKSQCTFCGLNGGSIAFRSKSPARALEELRYLRTRHGIGRACATDNVLDFRYHETLLPLLRDARLDLELEYELKTNLTRPQVETLVASGLRAAQLGIETLSTPVLRRMRKGVSAVQNVQTLKWLSATGIEVKWNFLHSVPGEDPADYAVLPALFDLLVHLVPPQAEGPVRIDRFSPYYQTPDAFALPAPRPLPAYRHIYPFPDETLARLAYYFTVDGGPRPGPPAYVEPTLEALERWRAVAGTVTLRQHDLEGHCLVIHDTRPCARAFEYRFTGMDRELYLFCDTSRSFSRIVKQAQQVDPSTREGEVRRLLERWVGDAIMVHLDGAFLSLAL